jgi:hypothetical protein
VTDRIQELEREVKLLERILELTRQLEELKAKQPAYIPYPTYPAWPTLPHQPYNPWPWYTTTAGDTVIS